ncbi:unnamed protein product [Prorocentrum cordatum]|uniref:Uncharacterized protein n=1 Tax=Prorocentrum cordatum TaxID=2364126 RepID=A0ABN9RRR1_9DINO|nr:unnamed protein product [Polarella glacialis]
MAVSLEEAAQLREEHAKMVATLQEERDRRASEQERLKERTRDTFQQLKDRCNAQVADMRGKLVEAEAESGQLRGQLLKLNDKLLAAERSKADSIEEVVGRARDQRQELAKDNDWLRKASEERDQRISELEEQLQQQVELLEKERQQHGSKGPAAEEGGGAAEPAGLGAAGEVV